MSTERTRSLWCTWSGLLLSGGGGPQTHSAMWMHLRHLLNQVRHKGPHGLCSDVSEGKTNSSCADQVPVVTVQRCVAVWEDSRACSLYLVHLSKLITLFMENPCVPMATTTMLVKAYHERRAVSHWHVLDLRCAGLRLARMQSRRGWRRRETGGFKCSGQLTVTVIVY